MGETTTSVTQPPVMWPLLLLHTVDYSTTPPTLGYWDPVNRRHVNVGWRDG